MASVFKKGKDKGRKGSCYYVSWTDESGKRRMRKAFSDKSLSVQLGARLENEAMLRKRGLIDPELDQLEKSGRSPIEGHLAEYEKVLRNRGTTSKHVSLALSRIKSVFEHCGVMQLKDVNQGKTSDFLHSMRNRKKQPIGHRTFNHYAQTLDGFCRWLVSTNRIAKNPLIGLERLNTEIDVRHRRRSLNLEEMSKLIEGAENSGQRVQGYEGDLRAKLYLCSYLTGLRRKELASLTPKSFAMASIPPTVTVEAACSKHRKQDILPLHPELVKTFSAWFETLGDEDYLLAGKKEDLGNGEEGPRASWHPIQDRERHRRFPRSRAAFTHHRDSQKRSNTYSSQRVGSSR